MNNTTKQTNKRVAAALISDAIAVLLDGYWAESCLLENVETGEGPSEEWVATITEEIQKIANPVFGRLENITKGFHLTDIEAKYK